MTRAWGRPEDSGATSSGPFSWARLFEQFFSADPHEAASAAATFARTIRFWIVRLGVRDAEVSSDDLVQDVLLELTRSRAHIVDAGSLGGWLRTTTVRKVQDRWRGARRTVRRENAAAVESMLAPVLLPEEHVLRKQDHSDLLEAIERLPPLLRACVQLQLRGLSEAEIAERLDATGLDPAPIRRHSVKNWLRKARGELRSALLDKHS
jgi:RNA polymerase sigma factor (sigma-70 family)